MRNIIYKTEFNDLDENHYLINIVRNAAVNSAATTIIPASTPLSIVYKKDDVFSPMFGSTATLNVVTNDYIQAIFTSNATEHYVEVYRNDVLFWQGYVTQNVFNQDFTNEMFEFEIELVDSLSVLKSIPFKSNTKCLSFKDYITGAFTSLPNTVINRIYVHDTLQINGTSKKVIESLGVYASNFKDEENKPNSQYEVLEAIAKYLNMTFFLKGDSLYLVSSESNNNNFYYYQKADNYSKAVTITIPFGSLYNITADSYTGSDNSLSITESYNKITVTNSLYEVSSIYPDFTTDGAEFIKETEVIHKDRRIKRRYYNSDKFDIWKYHKTQVGNDLYATNAGSSNPEAELGAYMVKMVDFAHSESNNSLNWETVLNVRAKTDVRLPLGSKLMNKKVNVESFAKNGFWASLNFKARCSCTDTGYNSKVSTLGHSDTQGAIIVPVQIKCGKLYYTGESISAWTTTPTTLYLKVGDLGKSTEMTDTWFNVQNTNTWQYKTPDLNGYMINFSNFFLEDELDIIFYTPYIWCCSVNHGYNKPITEPYYRNDEIAYFYIKDVDVRFQIPSEEAYAGDKITDKDRIIEDVITDSFTGSDYDIELLLSTNQKDSVNRSSVIFLDSENGNSLFTGFTIGKEKVIPEELIVRKHKVQLSKVRKKLNLHLKNNNLLNRFRDNNTKTVYVPIETSINVRYISTNLNLIELHE